MSAPSIDRAQPRVAPQDAVPPEAHKGGGSLGRGSPERSGQQANRILGLDRLRGVALVAMLVHHLTDWFGGDARTTMPGWPLFAVTDVAAVAFFVVAGASAALFLSSRAARGVPAWRRAGLVVRRYGLLVPIGMALKWTLWDDPFGFGVLEALGVTVVAAAAIAAVVPGRLLPFVTVATLVGGVATVRLTEGDGSWLASSVLRGTFPVVIYLGFVLVGMAAVATGAYRNRGLIAVGAAVGVGATAWQIMWGTVPARYPGDVAFIVPGLTGTALAYLVCQLHWPSAIGGFDRLLRRSGTHTLGLFVSHYSVYWVLARTGARGTLDTGVALVVAAVVTLAFCLAAPHVPQPPWSPRLGRRRSRGPSGHGSPAGGTGDAPASAVGVESASASR